MARTTTYISPRSWGGSLHSSIMIITLFLLQLTTLASAGVVFTNDEYVVRPNEPFTINWEGNRGPVTITLMNGADVDLQVVMVIASGLSGTKYTWTPPQALKTDGYELMIEDGVSNDYSPRFQYPAPPEPSTVFTPTPTAQTTFATSQTVSVTTSSPASTTTASSSSSDAASQTEGLSTGAKIGIAVGASILGLVLLALLGWFIYNKGKKAGSGNQNNPNMAEGGNGGPAPVGGYYAPSGTGTFDQDTMIGSNASKSPWAAAGSTAAARATTPFAELGQPEYTPRELWAGGIYQGPPPPDATKETVNVQERSYSVPLPIQHPGGGPDQGPPGGTSNMPPMYEYQDEIQQQQQQQRIQDDWHAVISPASRSGTGVTSNFSGPTGGMVGPGGFDFGTSPVSVTSSPPPMGYSATVTAGGPPSTPPPPGLGRYTRDTSDGSPLSFAARVYDEEYGHGRTGSRGASRGGGY
ncbi:hypothetical protein V8F33_000861 [Rhypophila sp. PSN 637]